MRIIQNSKFKIQNLRMKFLKVVLFLFVFLPSALVAANVTVKAEIDSVQILIGNQANLRLSVLQPQDEHVQFPIFDEQIPGGVDVVDRAKADTTKLGSNRIEIVQNYKVAAFDSGVYYMPPFKFVVKNDTFESNSLTLKAYTLPVDTTDAKIRDIKTVLEPPFSWKIFFRNIGIALFALAFVGAVVYVVLRKIKQKPILTIVRKKPSLLPHVVALHYLDKIKDEKLWQHGRDKEFHTQVTDVLRDYIEKRFGINAMEMTSDEILDSIADDKDVKPVFDKLKQVLKSADLVKFAKMKFLSNENELSLTNSYIFVNETKIEPVVNETNEKNEENEKI